MVTLFLADFAKENKRLVELSKEAMEALKAFKWPGNVRQLENMVKRLATLNESGCIELKELPPEIRFPGQLPESSDEQIDLSLLDDTFNPEVIPLKQHIRGIEESYIRRVIKYCDGDKDLAAKKLGVSLATLYRKIEPNGDAEEQL